MVQSNEQRLFATPKIRQLLAVVVGIWLGLVLILMAAIATRTSFAVIGDPILTPLFYLAVFGISSLWVGWQYSRQGIDIQQIFGTWPIQSRGRSLVGLWLLLFMFSLGAFQVSYALLSYWFPQFVGETLEQSIFLGPGETAFTNLYNLLMAIILVIAAPFLEEFLFRGFLLHRLSARWNPPLAVLLSSLAFGLLHGNVIGLTIFGLVMALLYLRTQSLWVVIAVHSGNNAIAAGLDLLSRMNDQTSASSVETLRSSIWLGSLLLAISMPWLVRFIRRNWPHQETRLPYFVNQADSLTD
ncbi:MAG: lysostaphin resistance A-like protein [Leptolyngbyaceae cyanobacterium]